MTTLFPEPEMTALLTAIDEVYSEAFRADPDLAAAAAATVTVDPSIETLLADVALPPWIVIVTHEMTGAIVAANFYDDPRAAVQACRDIEQETGGTSKGTLMPAAPLTLQEIDAMYPDDGETP